MSKSEKWTSRLKTFPGKPSAFGQTATHNPTGQKYSHSVIRITSLDNGRQWAIDADGGQYGHYQSSWDWDELRERHIGCMKKAYKLGATKTCFEELAKIEGSPVLTYDIGAVAADELDLAVRKKGLGLAKLVTLPDPEHGQQVEELLQTMEQAVHRFVKSTDIATLIREAKAPVRWRSWRRSNM
ncbi:hypothetical protein K458DRAFT_404922 [Lentithecium fluviatile CBS 122367]|uniref:Uncharacterized protein n=1 Tax=Lentithecium fluviatile CBS 122367 TaxID=1168545 RepID=A0A6G1IZH2_9PLEO|nr:hypothetical protein K458DRAFT_404922 [Lentithecium fluviatile CBS 122367]